MALLVRTRQYDRRRLLDRAARAALGRSGRKRRRAIALYREVLEREPHDPDLHRKIAPLLAREGDRDAAGASYRTAVATFVQRGFVDRAIGVVRDAVERMPRELEFWTELSRLELERGRKADAVGALCAGRRVFRGRRDRRAASALLTAAWRIAPDHLEVGLDLALQLRRAGARDRALQVLDGLPLAPARSLRRVRARQLRVAPGLGTLGRYLRARLLAR
jgi:tetratricopeptide (TPR) repeat protein